MKRTIALSLLVLAGAAEANDAALRQCRVLADAAARLACYDAMPLAAPAAVSPMPPRKAASAVRSAASAGAPGAPLAAPSAAAVPGSFGLPRPEEKTQEITSTIQGLFEGWGPGSRIRLANGQLWQVSDDSRGVYHLRDPKVTVRRAAMGTFVLDIDGANLLPRVRRLE